MAAAETPPTVTRMVGRRDDGVCVRVVMVGRRPDVRRALEIRLALERDVLVTGSEPSVAGALVLLRARRSHVLLIDLDGCPDLTAEALWRVRATAPGVRVVLLTHDSGAAGCAWAGADRVIDKGADAGPLLAAIRAAAQGFV